MPGRSHEPGSRIGLVALLVALTAAVPGCTAASPPPTGHGGDSSLGMTVPADVTVTPVGSALTTWQLPMDAYEYTPEQNAHLQAAIYTLVNGCMRQLGYSAAYPTHLNASPPRNAFRYGPVTDAQADHGYRWMLEQAGSDGAGGVAPTPAEYAALLGRTAEGGNSKGGSGETVPAGGCLGAAYRRLDSDGGLVDLPPLVREISDDSYALSQTAPQVRSAFHAWSTCMAKAGYDYGDPTAPGRDTGLVGAAQTGTSPIPPPSAREVAVARADVACKREGDLVSIWSSVERAMQDDAIAKHARELEPVPQEITRSMRNVSSVLGTEPRSVDS